MGEKDLDKRAEELSALMDGEVSELELRRVLKNLDQDEELGQKWTRYQLASAVLQQQTHGKASQWANIDLSTRVSAALESESQHAVSTKSTRSPFLKPFANVAVAASVSAAVILGWQNFGQAPTVAPGSVATTAPAVTALPSVAESNSPFMAVSQGGLGNQGRYSNHEVIRYSSSNDARLNSYLISHSSNAAMSTAAGVAPYARAVTITPSQQTVRVNLER